MHVFNLQSTECNAGIRLSATVESPSLSEPFELYYEVPHHLAECVDPQNGDACLAATLLAAMATGEPLHVEASVSAALFKHVQGIQDIQRSWHPNLDCVPVSAAHLTEAPPQQSSRRAVFFSLGVDSFHAVLKNRESATHSPTDLLLIEGFDKRARNAPAYYRMLAEHARATAAAMSLRLAIIRTNSRALCERFVPWGAVGHGAAIASCGLAVGNAFDEVSIAASFTYSTLTPWGSHPLLDPLWSTARTQFRHVGCEASRLDKLRICTQSPIAMQHLRVCYHNEAGAYNCGVCEKCVRTMLGLRCLGVLEDCATLPDHFDESRFVVLHDWELEAADQMLQAIRDGESRAGDAEAHRLTAAISAAMAVYEQQALEKKDAARRLQLLCAELRRMTTAPGFVILLDEDRSRSLLPAWLPVRGFPEVDGVYQGPPPDDAAAHCELERLRAAGAHHLIVTRDSLWWLDHYPRFGKALKSRFAIIQRRPEFVVFRITEEEISSRAGERAEFVGSGSER
jgi:hypothetical protein